LNSSDQVRTHPEPASKEGPELEPEASSTPLSLTLPLDEVLLDELLPEELLVVPPLAVPLLLLLEELVLELELASASCPPSPGPVGAPCPLLEHPAAARLAGTSVPAIKKRRDL
jgi:hypothetical protein